MSSVKILSVLQALSLLLSLVATVMAGIITVPQTSRCPNVEDENFPATVSVSLHISNQNNVPRRSLDYHSRSTSPWHLHRNEDSERYPSVIWEAKCRHLGCVDADGEVNYHMNSVPIQQEILVLRRQNGHCPHTFRLEKMLVTVGCTCVTPIVRDVRKKARR